MKKRRMHSLYFLILSIFLLLASLLVISTLTIAEQEDYIVDVPYNEKTVILEKGWNLVSIYSIEEYIKKDLVDSEDPIKAVFMYDLENKQYIRLYPNREQEKFERYINNTLKKAQSGPESGEYGRLVNAAVWVYSTKRQEKKFTTVDGPVKIKYVKIVRGWNLITVTPDIYGKSMEDLKGNCDIQKTYGWNAQDQKWSSLNVASQWEGFLIKVSNDCMLGSSTSGKIISPSNLPSEDGSRIIEKDFGNLKFTDSDIQEYGDNPPVDEDVPFFKRLTKQTAASYEGEGKRVIVNIMEFKGEQSQFLSEVISAYEKEGKRTATTSIYEYYNSKDPSNMVAFWINNGNKMILISTNQGFSGDSEAVVKAYAQKYPYTN